MDDLSRRNSHLGFCLHLEAEIARLKGLAFDPGHPLAWELEPSLAVYSAFLCAYPNNLPERREDSLKQLLEESSQWVQKYKVESLFGLFDAVYRLFDAVYRQRPQDEARRVLLAWLKAQAQAGFPGWREYLMPLIHEYMDREAVEALCDAIRYH
jgi:hypothetical protein